MESLFLYINRKRYKGVNFQERYKVEASEFYSGSAASTSPQEKYGTLPCFSARQQKQLLVLDWHLTRRPLTLLKYKFYFLFKTRLHT